MNNIYIPVTVKFIFACIVAICWTIFAIWFSLPWLSDLTYYFGAFLANFILYGVAILPGFMNLFLMVSLLIDRRPKVMTLEGKYPPLTILIAAYNEEDNIMSTLESISKQKYPGKIKAIVVNDGSTDKTAAVVRAAKKKYRWLTLVDLKKNGGKADALNKAVTHIETDLTVTIDGDSYLYKDALKNLVIRMLSDPPNTAAVAGAVMVRNSRASLITRMQEWEYFHSIASIKRSQSLFQGTLVAQGAFSIYKTAAIIEAGGWKKCVGEDIVLTWAFLKNNHRVGYAENACLFTNAPTTIRQLAKQRVRWARGMIEAFKQHWQLLFRPRMTTLFIWSNLTFPWIDFTFAFAMIPGIIAAFFGIFILAGPYTLLVIPLALLLNYIMFKIQSRMFNQQGLKVRRNILGFIVFVLVYSFIMAPVCVYGYLKEAIFGNNKNWGTK